MNRRTVLVFLILIALCKPTAPHSACAMNSLEDGIQYIVPATEGYVCDIVQAGEWTLYNGYVPKNIIMDNLFGMPDSGGEPVLLAKDIVGIVPCGNAFVYYGEGLDGEDHWLVRTPEDEPAALPLSYSDSVFCGDADGVWYYTDLASEAKRISRMDLDGQNKRNLGEIRGYIFGMLSDGGIVVVNEDFNEVIAYNNGESTTLYKAPGNEQFRHLETTNQEAWVVYADYFGRIVEGELFDRQEGSVRASARSGLQLVMLVSDRMDPDNYRVLMMNDAIKAYTDLGNVNVAGIAGWKIFLVLQPDHVTVIGLGASIELPIPSDASAWTAYEVNGAYDDGEEDIHITDASGQWTYVLVDGSAVLTGYVVMPSGNLTIPGEIDGNAVMGIGEYAFAECYGLSSVTIPEGVKRIGDGAFYGSGLPDVTIPNGVTNIGNFAFDGCYLTSVTMPDSVTSIGDLAFYGCDLSSVTIPGGVINIGVNPFSACEIERITVAENNPVYEDREGVLFDKKQKILVSYPIARESVSYAIPEGTRQIGDLAFSESLWLQDVTIPQGVTMIGVEAFSYCDSLIGVVIPQGVTGIGNRAFEACRSLTSMTIPEGVTSIGDEAFYCCERLTSVSIPESLTRIGDMAFMNCDITSVTIPASVTSIGLNAFANPNSEEISDDDEDGALYGNDKLTMCVQEGSYAEQYAKDNGIAYRISSEDEESAAYKAYEENETDGEGAISIGDLQGIPLETEELDLSCFGLEDKDIKPLAKLKALRKLDLFDNEITDLTPLSGLQNLEELVVFHG